MSRPDIGEPTGFTKISGNTVFQCYCSFSALPVLLWIVVCDLLPLGAGETENLTELENLNEETLLAELKTRYFKDTIYVSSLIGATWPPPCKPLPLLRVFTTTALTHNIGLPYLLLCFCEMRCCRLALPCHCSTM